MDLKYIDRLINNLPLNWGLFFAHVYITSDELDDRRRSWFLNLAAVKLIDSVLMMVINCADLEQYLFARRGESIRNNGLDNHIISERETLQWKGDVGGFKRIYSKYSLAMMLINSKLQSNLGGWATTNNVFYDYVLQAIYISSLYIYSTLNQKI